MQPEDMQLVDCIIISVCYLPDTQFVVYNRVMGSAAYNTCACMMAILQQLS